MTILQEKVFFVAASLLLKNNIFLDGKSFLNLEWLSTIFHNVNLSGKRFAWLTLIDGPSWGLIDTSLSL